MTVAVIVPTFNRAGLLVQALRSVLSQPVPGGVVVIVVDDGSTDETAAVLAAGADPRVRVIFQRNSGVSAARNTGLAALPEEVGFVTFLDSDDVFPAGRLAADLARLTAAPQAGYTYGRMCYVDEISPETLRPAAGARTVTLHGIQLGCGLYRRALIDRIGPFATDMTHGEDTDYLFRLYETGAAFVQHDDISLYYRRHTDNVTNQTDLNRRGFARALMRSMQRRRADPSLGWSMPDFALQPRPAEGGTA
ncbi:glycosyltransferase family 2 protein [Fuscovulum blasticum]|uniref:glycosyltransferase family 2 protein n=1 Tax=Fuscovulum blasticum TaxID=1075 RepID=UPI000D3E05CA|nr:glycosyltransferase family A protein [Fuscovulum blasticum]AWD23185.1 hypothetical protein B6K69_17150 [Fuscovulum blasticum]